MKNRIKGFSILFFITAVLASCNDGGMIDNNNFSNSSSLLTQDSQTSETQVSCVSVQQTSVTHDNVDKEQKDVSKNFLYTINDSGSIRIYDYIGDENVVVFPEHIGGMPVTEIACFGNERIDEIFIPESVTEIDMSTFMSSSPNLSKIAVSQDNSCFCVKDNVLYTKDMNELILYPQGLHASEFTLPEDVSYIGVCAFARNKYIERINSQKDIKGILDGAFSGCTNLSDILFSIDTEFIGPFAFFECSSLKSVSLKNVTAIGNDAFGECTLLETIELSDKLEIVMIDAFYGCSSLESIELPSENEFFCIYQDALCYKDMSKIIKLPPKSGIETFIIPSSVEMIDDGAFMKCETLKEVIIEDGATTSMTGNYFKDCVNLKKMYIPTSFPCLESYFENCPKLKIYTVEGSKADKFSVNQNFPVAYVDNCQDYLNIIESD